MIEKCQSFKTSDDKFHSSIEDAKKHELALFLKTNFDQLKERFISDSTFSYEGLANVIIQHQDKIIDLLTTKASSKLKARKVNGGTKKRASINQPAASGTPNLQ